MHKIKNNVEMMQFNVKTTCVQLRGKHKQSDSSKVR